MRFRTFLALKWLTTRDGLAGLAAVGVLFALLALLLGSVGCGRKPVTSIGAVAACGPLPPKVALCIESLPADAPDADVMRCYVNSVDQLIGENESLRVQFKPCAK